jgi:hypothetical protein
LPRGTIESDLPRLRTLNAFYAYHQLGLLDIVLGRVTRPGPSGFFHSYGRYREFTNLVMLGDSLDVVVRTAQPADVLASVFGRPYSDKPPWP